MHDNLPNCIGFKTDFLEVETSIVAKRKSMPKNNSSRETQHMKQNKYWGKYIRKLIRVK